MKATAYKVLNILALIAVIVVNTLANTLPINGLRTGEVSAQYENLITPAGFAFSIWSVIYLGLIAFVIFQALAANSGNSGSKSLSVNLGPPFLISCASNIGWIFSWHYQNIDLSLVFMGLLLVSLIDINIRVFTLRTGQTSKGFTWFVWAPLGLYLGWICVATIVNVAVYFTSIDWNQMGISATVWAVTMICVGGLVGLWLLLKMRLIPAAISIGWGLFGIFMKQRQLEGPHAVMTACLIMIGLLAIGIGWSLFKRKQSEMMN